MIITKRKISTKELDAKDPLVCFLRMQSNLRIRKFFLGDLNKIVTWPQFVQFLNCDMLIFDCRISASGGSAQRLLIGLKKWQLMESVWMPPIYIL